MPDDIFEGLEDAGDGNKYVSLKYTEYFPVVRNVEVEETRKRMAFLNANKAADKNTAILDDLVCKRHELALLLGFSSFSDYILE